MSARGLLKKITCRFLNPPRGRRDHPPQLTTALVEIVQDTPKNLFLCPETPDNPSPFDLFRTSFKLGFDQRQTKTTLSKKMPDRAQDVPKRYEGKVDHDSVGPPIGHPVSRVPDIGRLHERHPDILPEPVVQEPFSYINCLDR